MEYPKETGVLQGTKEMLTIITKMITHMLKQTSNMVEMWIWIIYPTLRTRIRTIKIMLIQIRVVSSKCSNSQPSIEERISLSERGFSTTEPTIQSTSKIRHTTKIPNNQIIPHRLVSQTNRIETMDLHLAWEPKGPLTLLSRKMLTLPTFRTTKIQQEIQVLFSLGLVKDS